MLVVALPHCLQDQHGTRSTVAVTPTPRETMATQCIPRARALVQAKKGTRELHACLLFAADALESDVARLAGVPAGSLRVFPTEEAAQEGRFGAPLPGFAARLRDQAQTPQRANLMAANYEIDDDTLVFHVAVLKSEGKARARGCSGSGAVTSRSRASATQMDALWEAINLVWPRDSRGVLLPSRADKGRPGAELAPRWAVPRVILVYRSILVNASCDDDLVEEDSIRRYGPTPPPPPVLHPLPTFL